MQILRNILALTLFVPAIAFTILGALLERAADVFVMWGDEIGSGCDWLASDLGRDMEDFFEDLKWWGDK